MVTNHPSQDLHPFIVSSSCYCCLGRRSEPCPYIGYKVHPPTPFFSRCLTNLGGYQSPLPDLHPFIVSSSCYCCLGMRSEPCSYIGYKVHPPTPFFSRCLTNLGGYQSPLPDLHPFIVSSSCYCCLGMRSEPCSYIGYKVHPPTPFFSRCLTNLGGYQSPLPDLHPFIVSSSCYCCLGMRSEPCSYIGYKVHPPTPFFSRCLTNLGGYQSPLPDLHPFIVSSSCYCCLGMRSEPCSYIGYKVHPPTPFFSRCLTNLGGYQSPLPDLHPFIVSSSCYCCLGRRSEPCSYIGYKVHPPTPFFSRCLTNLGGYQSPLPDLHPFIVS